MEERDGVRAGATGPDGGEPTTGAAADPAGVASDDGAPGDGAPDEPGTRTRRLLVVACALAVVAAVALGVALTTRDGGAPAGRTADPTATVTTARAPTPTASAAPDDPATSPAPDAPAPDVAAPAPDAAPPAAGGPVPVPPLGDVAPATGAGQEPVTAGPLTVAVTGLEAVTTGAEGIGEIASPGVVVTVEVRGPGGTQLDAAAVAAHAGADGVPLRPADTDGRSAPLPAVLPGDGVARGTYVFAAPAAGTPLAVTVLLRLDAPAVVVQGLVAP